MSTEAASGRDGLPQDKEKRRSDVSLLEPSSEPPRQLRCRVQLPISRANTSIACPQQLAQVVADFDAHAGGGFRAFDVEQLHPFALAEGHAAAKCSAVAAQIAAVFPQVGSNGL